MIRVRGPFARGPLPHGRGSESATPASRTHYARSTAAVDSCLPYEIPTVNEVHAPEFNPSSSLLTTCTPSALPLNHSMSLHFLLRHCQLLAHPYTHDLLALAGRSPSSQSPPLPPIKHFSAIATPLLQQAWAALYVAIQIKDSATISSLAYRQASVWVRPLPPAAVCMSKHAVCPSQPSAGQRPSGQGMCCQQSISPIAHSR